MFGLLALNSPSTCEFETLACEREFLAGCGLAHVGRAGLQNDFFRRERRGLRPAGRAICGTHLRPRALIAEHLDLIAIRQRREGLRKRAGRCANHGLLALHAHCACHRRASPPHEQKRKQNFFHSSIHFSPFENRHFDAANYRLFSRRFNRLFDLLEQRGDLIVQFTLLQ